MKPRIIVRILLVAVLIFSLTMIVRQHLDNSDAADSYSDARDLAQGSENETQTDPAKPPSEETQPPTTEPTEPKMIWVPVAPPQDDPWVQQLQTLDLQALREVNPEVVGWILIPDTKVDYPIVQGEDNEYYLNTTWDGVRSSVGSIFMECRNNPDFSDYHTIIYGHNMNNGSMFFTIRQYYSQTFWEVHPYVYILNDAGVWRYEIFSSYPAPVESSTYGLSFRQEQTKLNFLQMAAENSKIETGITPAVTDRVLTLSTCSGMGYTTRWVIHARLQMMEVAE